MAREIGYSIIDLSTYEEVSWSQTLPWSFTFTINDPGNPTGVVTLDRVGLTFPYGENPQYKVVERWISDGAPDGYTEIGYENPVFDGSRINVTGIYEPTKVT